MKTFDFEQYSDEWYKIRLGVPTASGFDKVLTADAKPSKQAKKCLYQLAGEFVCGVAEASYQSQAMLRGKELEAEARQLYEIINERIVEIE